ncbi:efflux RND transporter periplasmic adaptor subunit [Parasphingorhabdus cellanae]|uniref:efflux RND transporter periplasmic adaptor subunit n=1 Tax=Parasphingorhabdus cellanae TaxID=2806553 RepID=UPI001FB0EB44|nr:efflux RND transporter periplasmic adaptor subunit [Parasphingorhabdus cellanae]
MKNLLAKCQAVAGLVAASLIVSGCSGQDDQQPPPPKVSVAVPLQREVVNWDDYVGRFTAVENAEIRPRVSGTVQRIAFREGVEVRKGQLLFIIDPRPFRAASAQADAQTRSAQATLTNARTELTRARELLKFDAISKEEFEQKQAALRSAQANVNANSSAADNAQLNLSFTRVYAPISGRISDARVALGDFVTEGQSILTTVVTVDPIEFSFEGAESLYLKYVRQDESGERQSSRYANNPVEIQLADEDEYRWKGQMTFVDNAIDPNSGTVRARATIQNPNGFLIPGLFGRIRILGSGTYNAMLLPDEAIITDQDRKLVYILGKDNKVAQREVAIGPSVEGLRVVSKGLKASDKVVLDGLVRLRAGAVVDPQLVKIKPQAENDSPVSVPVRAPPASEATTAG